MTVRRGLLRILWWQALPATLVGAVGLAAYVLLWPDVMTGHDAGPWLPILLQCVLLARLLGRFRSPGFAFLCSRGYSRHALWGHLMLASGLSIALGWLPAALIVWTGLRSAVRDHLCQSPLFPLMAPRETWLPWFWLGMLLLYTYAFQYVWIRAAQPTKGGAGGYYAALAMLLAMVMALTMANFLPAYVPWLAGASAVVTLLALVIGGRALHCDLEVRA